MWRGIAARFAADPGGFAAALRAALESPGELRAAGRALAARYTWQAAAAAHIAAYEHSRSIQNLNKSSSST